jgi:hypothetical protein
MSFSKQNDHHFRIEIPGAGEDPAAPSASDMQPRRNSFASHLYEGYSGVWVAPEFAFFYCAIMFTVWALWGRPPSPTMRLQFAVNSSIFDKFQIKGFRRTRDFVRYEPTNCRPCNFAVRNLQSDSTSRDLVVTFAMDRTSSMQVFVQSLRTTGCRASVVIFANWKALDRFIPDLFGMLRDCGCTVIPIGRVDASEWQVNFFRHIFLYWFFKERRGLFNRVLVGDMFDTVFQGDPFHTGLPKDFVGVSSEGLAHAEVQSECARRILETQTLPPWWNELPCKNAGMFIASAQTLERLLRVYREYADQKRHLMLPDCQYLNTVVFNILIDGGSTRNISIKIFDEGSHYRTLTGVWGRKNVTYSLGEYRLFKKGEYPLVLHMFDRSKQFCESVRTACPPLFRTLDDHMWCKIAVD